MEVVRALLEVPGGAQQAMCYLKKAGHRLNKDRYGAMLLAELGLPCDSDVAREAVSRRPSSAELDRSAPLARQEFS